MSLTKSRAIIRRLPLPRRNRLSIFEALGADARFGTRLKLDENSRAVYTFSYSSYRRSLSSSAFFSTAPSADLLEEEEYYNENGRENRSYGTSSNSNASADSSYEQSTLDRIVSGGFGDYQSVDVDSVVTEDYLQRLVDDHISNSKVPPNPNMLLNMLELLHNEETHISNETIQKIFKEVVRSKRVKLLTRAEEVVVKNRYDPLLLRLLVTGYVNAGAPRQACKLLMEWPNESMQHQPGIESYRRVLTALGYNAANDNRQQKDRRRRRHNNRSEHNNNNDNNNDDDTTFDNNNNNCDDQYEQGAIQENHHLAHQLLKHMCFTHQKFPELSLAPDRDCFHRVLGTCSTIESLSTAREILHEMNQFACSNIGQKDDTTSTSMEEANTNESKPFFDTQPSASTIRLLLKVWSTVSDGERESIEMQKEVFEFLRRIEADALSRDRQEDLNSSMPTLPSTIVDIDCYNILLNKLAELGQYELAENMFRRLLGDFMKGEKSNVQPDTVTLNTVLKSHVVAHTQEAAASAERFLERLDDFYEQQERIRKNKPLVIDQDYDDMIPRVVYEIQPTARARSIISNLWVKLGHPHRAAELLAKTEEVYRDKEQKLRQHQQQNPDAAHLYSLDTIKRFRPDKITYRQIIGGLCKLQDPPTAQLAIKAEEIGDRMCRMGHRLNLLTCNTILNCWTKAGDPDRAEIYLEETMQEHNVIPDAVSYNTIIHGHARLGNLDRALELLTRLLDDALTNSSTTDNTQQLYPKPNVRTFTNILVALSKEKTVKAAEEAERLLLRMQELNDPPYNLDTRPNNVTYNAVMNCWASLSLPSSRRRKKRQNQKAKDDDTQHYEFGRKAEFVLRSMQGLGKNEKPNAISYNTVIRAYSNDMNKAEELVRDMIENGIEPTDHTYSTLVHVLNRDNTIQDKDKKLEEIKGLYFASSTFAFEKGRSPNNKKSPRARKRKKKGSAVTGKTSNSSERQRQQ